MLVSFWVVAGVLVGLRAGGRLLGWGFQFQDPVVVVVTAVLFFLIGLNLFGVFDVGTFADAARRKRSARTGGTASFLNGVFATAVATPCTAPFMGAAVGYALSHSVGASFGVFSALALGMAAPFLLLSAVPGLVARLPKPGPWMETLRQVMAFPMMGAAVWMVSVLAALAGSDGVILLLGAMLAAGLGAWIWGRWGALSRPACRSRRCAACVAVLLAVGGTVGARRAPAAAEPRRRLRRRRIRRVGGVGAVERGAAGPLRGPRHAGLRGFHRALVPDLPGERKGRPGQPGGAQPVRGVGCRHAAGRLDGHERRHLPSPWPSSGGPACRCTCTIPPAGRTR